MRFEYKINNATLEYVPRWRCRDNERIKVSILGVGIDFSLWCCGDSGKVSRCSLTKELNPYRTGLADADGGAKLHSASALGAY